MIQAISYVINPLVLAQAMVSTLNGPKVYTQATYIHGSPAASLDIDRTVLSDAVLKLADGETDILVINGLDGGDLLDAKGQPLAYPGAAAWMEILVDEFGVDESRILIMPPAKHTAAESDNLLKLAAEKGWDIVGIMSWPHHILRCAMQMVFCQTRAQSTIKVYPSTVVDFTRWHTIAKKGVLNAAPFVGTLIDAHMGEEVGRVIRYANMQGKDHLGSFTPHWTLEALVHYCKWRDGVEGASPPWELPEWVEYQASLDSTKVPATA